MIMKRKLTMIMLSPTETTNFSKREKYLRLASIKFKANQPGKNKTKIKEKKNII